MTSFLKFRPSSAAIALKLALLASIAQAALADAMQPLPLNDLQAFRPQAGNWSIVGEVQMDPNVDTHHDDYDGSAVSTKQGHGIVLNENDDDTKDALITKLEHGDIELQLEVMLPKGSNSGIYLQGRYELQLYDSWGVRSPSFSDIGGIYRNWREYPEPVFRGIAPQLNAARAPGLWQTLKLSFRAPHFDEAGNKIANARFDYVDLNGIRIHENVEVPHPTGGPIAHHETSLGPIMIQGDHGPVALRNINYRLIRPLEARLSEVTFKYYNGEFESFQSLQQATADEEGNSRQIDISVGQNAVDKFAVNYQAELEVEEAGTYQVNVMRLGALSLKVGDDTLVDVFRPDEFKRESFELELAKGSHPIQLLYAKSQAWRSAQLTISISKEDTHPFVLTTAGSDPRYRELANPIFLEVGSEPRLHRGFLNVKGKRHSHALAVGTPEGIHYAVNLSNGALLALWSGPFVDATPMWHDRGNGTFRPRGATVYLEENSPFPESEELTFKGYHLDRDSKLPKLNYLYKDIEYIVYFYPQKDGNRLIFEITPEDEETTSLPALNSIVGNSFEAINDSQFRASSPDLYFEPLAGKMEILDAAKGKKQIRFPSSGTKVSYELAW